MQRFAIIFAIFFTLGLMHLPSANAQDVSFDAYLENLRAKARGAGVSEATIERMTEGLSPNAKVIALDRNQPGSASNGTFSSVALYIRKHVSPSLVQRGKKQLVQVRDLYQPIERQYGVPLHIVLAIWGHETNYGSFKGNFDLARSLSTLAWEGRRRELFENEFVALLKIADRGFTRDALVGSWAGAFGNPQFMPSVYLRIARDGDGDGKADIMQNQADTLASIAHYFNDAGWKKGEPWGVRAIVPTNFNWGQVTSKMRPSTCARVLERHSKWQSIAEWRARGVIPQSAIAENVMATLFQPDGVGTQAYLLTTNYRVILRYNCSNYYAMSVGLLSDEIDQ